MDRKKAIQGAYKALGKEATFYDGMITCSTLLGKAICKVVWNMNQADNNRFIEAAVAGIPEQFCGKLLEVPVGTGVLTMPIYQTLSDADIMCLDYSADMMASAQKKAERISLGNVHFRQGDVGALPFTDGSFDIVLSMNGFHAFPDKEAAYQEIFRVLKPGGIFCGCFYIKGENRRTDWFFEKLYTPKGFFTPPYETQGSLKARLEEMYEEVEISTVESMACFACRKGE